MTIAPDHTLIDVRPTTPRIGAEIHGVDLSGPLDDAVIAEIRTALLRWKVIFFRDQHIGPKEQVAFGRRFGSVTPAHPTLPALEGHPEVLELGGTAYQWDNAAVEVESRWHTDVTFVPNPPLASILRGVVVPPYGGDTQWANLVSAYESLSEPLQRLVDTLHAVHRNDIPVVRNNAAANALRKQFTSTAYRTVHPVVRIHPETGERALFVNPNFTEYLEGLTNRESDRILELLYEHIAHPDHVVRLRWQPGTIAFWDNRATVHLAPTDLRGTGFERVMHRITLAGDEPVGPDGFVSQSLEGSTFA